MVRAQPMGVLRMREREPQGLQAFPGGPSGPLAEIPLRETRRREAPAPYVECPEAPPQLRGWMRPQFSASWLQQLAHR